MQELEHAAKKAAAAIQAGHMTPEQTYQFLHAGFRYAYALGGMRAITKMDDWASLFFVEARDSEMQ